MLDSDATREFNLFISRIVFQVTVYGDSKRLLKINSKLICIILFMK